MYDTSDPEIERLARALASRTGETPAQAIIIALRERLDRAAILRADDVEARIAAAQAIAQRSAARPIRDHRDPEAMLDYDEYGVPR